jgi:hypothetical protein
MHADTADVIAGGFAFAGVQPGAHLDVEGWTASRIAR